MAFMSLKDIDVSYDKKKQILKGLNLDVEKGELVSLLGPSGCGKSTTLRVVAGFIDPQGGSFLLDGEDMTKVPVHKRNFGLVFQSYALFPHLSVYDNVAFGLRTRKMDKELIDKKVKDILEVCGLSDLANRFPRQMSGGQRQRVALARSLVIEPKLLLLDEPLSNLDAKLRTQMRKEISKLYRDSSSTFIYVTHDQIEAMTLGTKIVVLNHGQIQQIATPRELYESPANLFVAGFIGSPQMNFWKVRVEQDQKRVKLVFDDMGEFVLSEPKAQLLRSRGWLGRQIIVGVRPENLRVMKPEEADHRELEEKWLYAVAKVFEMDGAVSYLHLESVHDKITICMKGQKVYDIDQIVSFTFDETKIHFFDPETEEAIR